MFGKIASFEFRYQVKNPVFWVATGIFFLLTFGSVTVDQISIGGGGNIHKNSPFAIIQTHLILSIFFMFVSTAFVANVIVRDDETGFGPMILSTRIRRFDYLYGRFAGALAAALLAFLAVPLAMLVGSFMPWVDPETLGPLSPPAFLSAYFVFALPNILLTSAIFFTLATLTRSLMWTYVGVIGFLIVWIIAGIAADKPEFEQITAVLEPLGASARGRAPEEREGGPTTMRPRPDQGGGQVRPLPRPRHPPGATKATSFPVRFRVRGEAKSGHFRAQGELVRAVRPILSS